jgi:5-methyltetrahydropteroyltriglutamate--homocysteine methyltransferase
VNPRIKTTVVGSYPVPSWLVGNTSRLVLRDAVMSVLKTQELAGLDLISDGELMRFDPSHPETNGMIDYFVSQLEGIRKHFSLSDFDRFRADRASGFRLLTAGMVVERISEGTLNLPRDYEFSRVLTKTPLKFTCTGPHMLARLLTNCFYKDTAELAMDIADILRRQLELIEADTVQLDEASIVGFPQDAPWAAEAINHALSGILNEKAVHICFGNYGGQPMLRGFWRDLIPFLNSLDTDHLVLEFARRGYEELSAFNELDPKIGLGIGVIDIKDNEVESRELIASRIEKIAKTIGAERLHYVHPDCGFWMLQRSVVDRKMRALVEGRDLFEGREREFPASSARPWFCSRGGSVDGGRRKSSRPSDYFHSPVGDCAGADGCGAGRSRRVPGFRFCVGLDCTRRNLRADPCELRLLASGTALADFVRMAAAAVYRGPVS